MTDRPTVLFVCVHNAGRSQMAAAWLQRLSGGAVEVRSAGSAPADAVNPAAVEALLEVGIDMAHEVPKVLTTDAARESAVVIPRGCGAPSRSSPASATRTGSSTTRPVRGSRPCGPSVTRSGPAS